MPRRSATPIRNAMVLAAGLGKRMRPITDKLPKPLVSVLGTPMLDRVLDHLERDGVTRAVVNLHHLGGQIETHLKGREAPEVVFSHEEDELLETGGGVKRALPHLGDGPFMVANSDAVWLDGPTPALERMRVAWDGRRMDALLLLFPTVIVAGYEGSGDYFMEADGRLTRRTAGEVSPFLYAGVQILHPRLFKTAPEGRFSLNRLYDEAQERGRLYGIRHDGAWFHVGTPDSIELVERILTLGPSGRDWL